MAALAVPGSAVAQAFTHPDAAHDVQRFDVSTRAITKAKHNRAVDVVRIRLSYTDKRLLTAVWLRSGTVGRSWLMEGQIHTGSTAFVWDATRSGSGKILTLRDASGAQIACTGLGLDIKRRKGRVMVSVPSSCLAVPDAVKEGVLFGTESTDTVFYLDDALQKRGVNADGVLALSRKLHRDR